MSTVKERLKKYLIYKGLKVQPFEKSIGASNGYVSGMVNTIGNKYLNIILTTYPDLNRDWLLYGEGEMLNSPADQRPSDLIPLIPMEATAGYSDGFADGVSLPMCNHIKNPFPGSEIAIQVSGDSMTPDIKSGDRLYLKRINERAFMPWGHAVVLDTINGALVKEIYPCDDDPDYIIAKSTNPKYPPYRVEVSSILGVYKIVGSTTINSTF